MDTSQTFAMSYGKERIPIYRVYARTLSGFAAIPESTFTEREQVLFALEVDVEVIGDNFLPAYTHGDNTNVVATDSMKNFVLREALDFAGATMEELLEKLGQHFLQTYPQMERLRLTGRELPFTAVTVPEEEGEAFGKSSVLFSRAHGDYATTTLEFARAEKQAVITEHRCGHVNMELFKVTGSAFSHFVRDEYTTLPERVDRPLFIHLDVYWKYINSAMLVAIDHASYVPAEQVRDVIQVIFHQFVSESIQHLVHEMGNRLLARFPQLQEVTFEAQNRTRDLVAAASVDEKVKVYTEPFSAYGVINFTIKRNT